MVLEREGILDTTAVTSVSLEALAGTGSLVTESTTGALEGLSGSLTNIVDISSGVGSRSTGGSCLRTTQCTVVGT